jgi:HAD superfamily hydrolase (TIGR01509 family)
MTAIGTDATLRAVLFDFDGLILDTETTRLQAWTTGLARVGVAIDVAAYIRLTLEPPGCSRSELARALLRDGRGADFIAELVDQISADSLRLASGLEAMPGSHELMSAAREAGIHTALVTGSARPWINLHLSRLGLADSFDVIVACGDAPADKPDPAPYRLVLRVLGVSPAQAIALDDSPIGVTSAHGAGVACVAVPNRVTTGMDFGHACAILPSLANATAATLAQILHSHSLAKR